MSLSPFNADVQTAQLVYLYDGTLEGLLSAVFESYLRHEDPVEVTTELNLQQSLLHSYIPLIPSIDFAQRVQTGLVGKLGPDVYSDIKQVFLSDDPAKGGVILRFIKYLMASKKPRQARTHLANPAVADFESILRVVSNEAHFMLQFVRFAQLTNGVYFSQIDPQACVVPLIMDHFAARFNIQPFLIYDARHKMSGVFDTERWWLVDASEIQVPPHSELEDEFQSLWQTFYDTVAIKERTNPTCQRNFMPKRFWGNMCEQIPKQLRRKNPQTATPTQIAKALAGGAPQPTQQPAPQFAQQPAQIAKLAQLQA